MTLIYRVSDYGILGWAFTDWTTYDWYQADPSAYGILEVPVDFIPVGHLILADPSAWKIDPDTLELSLL